jgi:hypothetical protein
VKKLAPSPEGGQGYRKSFTAAPLHVNYKRLKTSI